MQQRLLGSKKDEPDKIQKILVSSGVDIGGSLLTGAAAAGAVSLGAIVLVGAGTTAPLWLMVGATIGVGFLFDIGLETLGVKKPIKEWLNTQIDNAQSVVSNWWNTTFNQPAPTPAQPAIPAPASHYSPPVPTGTPPASLETPAPPEAQPAQTPQATPTATPEP